MNSTNPIGFERDTKNHRDKAVKEEKNLSRNIRVEMVTKESQFDQLHKQWNTLAKKADIHVFQTYEWLRTWWEYFARESNWQILHLLLFWQNGRLVGIAPFFIDRYTLAGFTLYRCLRLIGTKMMINKEGRSQDESTFTDYSDIIVHPGFEKDVCSAMWNWLRQSDEYDDIIMEEIPGNSALINHFVSFANDGDESFKIATEDSSTCLVADLPDSWDDFLEDLSSNARYEVRRYLKRARDNSEKKVYDCKKLEQQAEARKAFDWLVDTHQERWNGRGRPGAFANQRTYNFYRDVTFRFFKQGIAQLQVISPPGEDRFISVDLIYRYNKSIYGIHRSFDESSTYAEYGPGHTSLYTIVKDAIEAGLHELNFLRGKEHYKSRAANQIIQNKNIIVQRSSSSYSTPVILFKICRRLSLLKCRVRSEWNIIKLYCEQYRFWSGLYKYKEDVRYRFIRKFKSKKR